MRLGPRSFTRRPGPVLGKRRPDGPPPGQLAVPSVGDLAAITLRRAYERVEAGVAGVSPGDAVALLRLAHEIEHDAALAERDAARRQMEEWQHGLQLIRDAVVRQHGQAAWLAIAAEVREARPGRN